MSKKGSSPYLKGLFNKWNQKYWGGRLPGETVVRWASHRELSSTFRTKRALWGGFFYAGEGVREAPTILLNEGIRRKGWMKTAKETLVHEMCHLEGFGRDNHGPAFNKRMLRVAKLGIFNSVW